MAQQTAGALQCSMCSLWAGRRQCLRRCITDAALRLPQVYAPQHHMLIIKQLHVNGKQDQDNKQNALLDRPASQTQAACATAANSTTEPGGACLPVLDSHRRVAGTAGQPSSSAAAWKLQSQQRSVLGWRARELPQAAKPSASAEAQARCIPASRQPIGRAHGSWCNRPKYGEDRRGLPVYCQGCWQSYNTARAASVINYPAMEGSVSSGPAQKAVMLYFVLGWRGHCVPWQPASASLASWLTVFNVLPQVPSCHTQEKPPCTTLSVSPCQASGARTACPAAAGHGPPPQLLTQQLTHPRQPPGSCRQLPEEPGPGLPEGAGKLPGEAADRCQQRPADLYSWHRGGAAPMRKLPVQGARDRVPALAEPASEHAEWAP